MAPVSPISKPASRQRKPKPLAILRVSRLCAVLETKNHSTRPAAASSAAWYIQPRFTKTSLADRRRVHQAALGPEVVQAAREAERLQVRVEALAVVADLLDD